MLAGLVHLSARFLHAVHISSVDRPKGPESGLMQAAGALNPAVRMSAHQLRDFGWFQLNAGILRFFPGPRDFAAGHDE